MKKSLMFPFLFAALLALCACTQGTEADAPTANAGITLTLRAAEHPELDFGMAGEQRALMDFAVGVVEPSSEETYRMAFSDEALTIQPIGAYFSGRESGTDYVLTR